MVIIEDRKFQQEPCVGLEIGDDWAEDRMLVDAEICIFLWRNEISEIHPKI